MSDEREQTFESVLARIEQRERTARFRATLYTLVPIITAVTLLSYTTIQVGRARAEKEQLDQQVENLTGELQEARKQLQQSSDLVRFVHPIGMITTKMIASRDPEVWPILGEILRLRDAGVTWRLGGQSPDAGFDSPSFAAFVLRRVGTLGGDVRPGESSSETSGQLQGRLQPTATPHSGDLAFYEAGYALFYFLDENNRPFVIGMTPFGIVALEPDFAKRIGFYRSLQ